MALRRAGDMLASKYRIEELLGSGGMGDVYRARNMLVDREVAIKLLHIKHVGDANLVERFVREARVANIVRHPNVVDVLDIDKDADGSPFIVQELLQGEDLSKYAKTRGRLDLTEVRELVVPIIEAVAAAHDQGVIHRDIKPANVFLSIPARSSMAAEQQQQQPPSSGPQSGLSSRGTPRSGVRVIPKLLDFGISKLRAADIRATDVGVVMGTPAYMAPELVAGVRDANAQSDVWAIGVMLFELVAGRRPYTATGSAVYVAIATTNAPPILSVHPAVDPDVAHVIDRCLKRSLEERFSSAVDLANALTEALTAALARTPVLETIDLGAALLIASGPVVPDLDLPPTVVGAAERTIADSTLASSRFGASSAAASPPQEVTEPMSSAPEIPASARPSNPDASNQTVRLESPISTPRRVSEPQLELATAVRSTPTPTQTNPPSSASYGRGAAPPPSSARAHNEQLVADKSARDRHRLMGLISLASVSLVVTAVLLAVAGRASGWPVVRPFVETTPQIVTMAQIGASIACAIVVVRSYRRALARWMDNERSIAIVFASTTGLLLFIALELLIAAW